MDEPEIRISVKAFCPQMTLPCVKGKAYPDPYSCRHYYSCDVHGEIRRFTCGTDSTKMVRIKDGAAICVTKKDSTCNSLRPRRQCDTLSEYLPHEYCEVEVPAGTNWRYPDPEHCQGYYRYTPPDLTVNGRNALVVERLPCPRGTYYSPQERDCTAAQDGVEVSCGGRWIRENDECRIVKTKSTEVGFSYGSHTTEDTNHGRSDGPRTTDLAVNGSLVTNPPQIVQVNALSMLAWVVGLASALVILTIIVTVGLVIYQKRRQKGQIQSASYSLQDTQEINGMDIARPLSFAELNEYAAIDEVFGNTLERSMLTQTRDECVGVTDNTRQPTTCGRSVPDDYGPSEAPSLPPRPKSQPSYSSAENKNLKPNKAVGCCANHECHPLTSGAFCKVCATAEKKEFYNVNWQTALNASMAEESCSSDEYEAIMFGPHKNTSKSLPHSDVEETDNAECSKPEQFDKRPELDNEEYMIPVIAREKRSIPETAPLVVPLRIGRRTHSLPHRGVMRYPSFVDRPDELLVCTSCYPDTLIDKQHNPIYNADDKKNKKESDAMPVTFDCHEKHTKDAGIQFPRQPEDNQEWDISDSWTRGESVSGFKVPDKIPAEEEKASAAEKIPSGTIIIVDGQKSVSDDDTTDEASSVNDLPACPDGIMPPVLDAASETNVEDMNEPSFLPGENFHVSKANTPDSQQQECGSEESAEQMCCKTEETAKLNDRPLGYEILVTTSSPTDFRVYQCISADSTSNSSSEDDLQSIPDIELSLLASSGSVKNHEYYILDKHHSSDNSVDASSKQTRNMTVFEPKQRQSCNF